MSYDLEALKREVGIQLASHVWGTTVTTQALIATPGAGKFIRLRYISVAASAPGSVRITTGTSLATAYYVYPGAFPYCEEILSDLDTNTAATLFCTAGVGNGFIRVYYSIERSTGTTE